ncbi:MAG: alpha/beta hydrolase [Trichodesmium sp. MAG_R02]|jgi:pimeloyl-ACP methyl ester carboxylesterase|nr:alpha/beta hydrolase [Trichodesmium sp. MAG_R02]
MSKIPDILWLNTSPSLKVFNQRLIRYLSRKVLIAEWDYLQTPDEPCLLDIAVTLLHDYLKSINRPIHLIGHSTSGLVGLIYARKYPERVKSLTLLSVGVYPTVDWQAHYYVHRHLLPCSRETILRNMVKSLFGEQGRKVTQNLVKILERDLDLSPSPHSLLKRQSMVPREVSVPLMICGSCDDTITDPNLIQGWQPFLKSEDRIWECPEGGYFFHHFSPLNVAQPLLEFWQENSFVLSNVTIPQAIAS